MITEHNVRMSLNPLCNSFSQFADCLIYTGDKKYTQAYASSSTLINSYTGLESCTGRWLVN